MDLVLCRSPEGYGREKIALDLVTNPRWLKWKPTFSNASIYVSDYLVMWALVPLVEEGYPTHREEEGFPHRHQQQ